MMQQKLTTWILPIIAMEPDMPAVNFWSMTVYDIDKRVVIRNEVNKADVSSRTEGLQVNALKTALLINFSTKKTRRQVCERSLHWS